MALSDKTMRGLTRYLSRLGIAAPRVVIWSDDITPVYEPLFIRPTEVPSGTLAEGAIWFDDDNHTIAFYDGTNNVEVVKTTSTGDLTVVDDLNVGDDLNLTSTGAVITIGPAATDPITLTQSANTLTLGTGDTFVADDITTVDDLNVGDDLNLTSTGAIITIGPAATDPVVITHSANTLTFSAGDSLVVGDDLSVGDDLNLTSTGAVITVGPAATDPVIITHTANVLTLAAGDKLVAPLMAGGQVTYTTPATLTAADCGALCVFSTAAG